jgi:hypothetical protein
MTSMTLRIQAWALCPLLLLTLSHAQAAEDPVPYYLGISQTETADTNIFRRPKSAPILRDLISSTALIAGLDQPLGRGKLVGDIQLNTNHYKNNRQLNYNGGQGNLRLDWESINRLAGDIGVYRRQNLYNTPSLNGSVSNERDVVSDIGGNIGIRMGLVTLWSLEGGLAYNQTRHSNSQQSSLELDQTSGNLGIRLRPSDLWSVRLGLRETSADYPRASHALNGEYFSDKVSRHDIDLSGTWTPSGASQLDARLSATRQKHTLRGYRSSNLATGLLGYNWLITGKTKLRATLSRDASVGAGDRNLGLLGQPNGDASVSNQLSLTGTWEATAKITTEASYAYSQRKLEATSAQLTTPTTLLVTPLSGRDTTNTLALGATYHPNSHLQLGCKLTHEQRSAQGQVSSSYAANTGMCQLQLRL